MKINISGELSDKISEIFGQLPELIAELAGQYFQDAFTRKAFDGNPWPQNKDPRRQGSELVKSGALRGSLSVVKLPDKVVVSFGNEKVGYAQVHNEGFDGEVVVPAHVRRTRRGEQQVRAHTRHMRIPQRQFLGEAQELDELLQTEIEALVKFAAGCARTGGSNREKRSVRCRFVSAEHLVRRTDRPWDYSACTASKASRSAS